MNPGQSLADGAAGVALLPLETGDWPAAYAALRDATAHGVSTAAGASLFYGAPALAFVLATTNRPGLARARSIAASGTATVTRRWLHAAHRRTDSRQRPHYAEYDLIRSLTGLGVGGDSAPVPACARHATERWCRESPCCRCSAAGAVHPRHRR